MSSEIAATLPCVPLAYIADYQRRITLLQEADVALIIMGPQWHLLPPGTPGIDAMRADIDYLFHYGHPVLILPILINGATMPPASALAPQIQPLAYVQAISIADHLTDTDLHQIRLRIHTARKTARKVARLQGNFRWFKFLSYAPLGASSLYALIGVLSASLHISPSSAVSQNILLFGQLLFFAAIWAVWVSGIIVTLLAHRFGWLTANILYIGYLPMAIVLIILGTVFHTPPGTVMYTVIAIAIVLLAIGTIFQPILFGLNVPPFRKQEDTF